MEELKEIKIMLEAAEAGQIQARNEFAKRLGSLGFYNDGNIFPHPNEKEKEVVINFQNCYGFNYSKGEDNDFMGYFRVDVVWQVPHECNEVCDHSCQEELDFCSRPATAEEIIEVLRKELTSRLSEAENELQRDWELTKLLPTADELAKVRRRVEDHLRKNPKDILAVAKLLKVI